MDILDFHRCFIDKHSNSEPFGFTAGRFSDPDPDSAFVLVTTRDSYSTAEGTVHPTFLTGIARGDVTRVVVDQRPDWPAAGIYDRKQGSLWGTFELSLSDSRAIRLAFFRRNGGITRMPIDVTEPGDRLTQIPG